jgi:hypothetical protein
MQNGDNPNPVGRPLAFKSVEELQAKIEEYFEWCDNRIRTIWDDKAQAEVAMLHPAPYTMSGLARRLGVDRDTIINYSHKEEFFGTIRDARERVHEDVETRLMDTKNEKGAIFNLKNNFGWKDKSETDLTSKGEKLQTIEVVAYGGNKDQAAS